MTGSVAVLWTQITRELATVEEIVNKGTRACSVYCSLKQRSCSNFFDEGHFTVLANDTDVCIMYISINVQRKTKISI